MIQMNKKEQIIELQTKLAELQASKEEDGEGEEAEVYSLTEAELDAKINAGIANFVKTAPKGQPAFSPKPDAEGKPAYRQLVMKR